MWPFNTTTPPPVPSLKVIYQPHYDGRRAYTISKAYQRDGSTVELSHLSIELEGHRDPYVLGDVMWLTDVEAGVLGKRYLLEAV